MRITLEWLKEKGACSLDRDWFEERFPKGEEYQAVLDVLAHEDNYNWASWLLERAGRTTDVLEIEGDFEVKFSLFFAGSIVIKGALTAAKWILAGGGIKAGLGIKAGEGIKAGLGIEAGEGIEAGKGIEAGGASRPVRASRPVWASRPVGISGFSQDSASAFPCNHPMRLSRQSTPRKI